MMHVGLELGNRADVDALREPFREFAQSDEDAIDPDDAVCEGISQNARAMTVRFMVRAKDPKTGWKMHCRLREHMLAAASRLDAAAGHEPAPAFLPRPLGDLALPPSDRRVRVQFRPPRGVEIRGRAPVMPK